LDKDPFAEPPSAYVPLPGQEEALARLIHTVDAGHRLAILSGPRGVGKTSVLNRALLELRSIGRRIAMVTCPPNGPAIFGGLAMRLGHDPALIGANPAASWLCLEREVRVSALQGLHVVLSVDGCHMLQQPQGFLDIERLCHLGESSRGTVTVFLVDGDDSLRDNLADRSWSLEVRVRPLMRSEVELYLTARLASAGCAGLVFTPRAVTRLHALSGGITGGVNCLASLCLMAGASRGLEAIPSDVVDAVAQECHLPSKEVLHR
jgi:general secretion pathway protein A